MDPTGIATGAIAGTSIDLGQEHPHCVFCPVRDSSFCAALRSDWEDSPCAAGTAIKPAFETIRAREVFYRAESQPSQIYAICDGWAVSFLRLRNGRRHILHVLVPGDFVGSVFREGLRYPLQAVTDIRVAKYDRTDIRARLIARPNILSSWIENRVSQDEQIALMAVALGQFTAHERIATLILWLRDRLAGRGMVTDETFRFPLRQTHIADATGLTTVHVSRVLGGLRKAGLLAIDEGVLRILDLPKLRRIADVV